MVAARLASRARGAARVVGLLLVAGSLAACGSSGPSPRSAASVAPSTRAQADRAVAETLADKVYDRMTPEQRVGQLFMFGVTTTGPSDDMYDALARHAVGNVFLRGSSDRGVEATAAITARLTAAATVAGARPFVSADQEGGNAQSLEGPGFSAMPSGTAQGAEEPAALRASARTWAGELRDAGVNLDLAPVADVVPAEVGTSNDPIGFYWRQYASTPAAAVPGVRAFVRGMDRAGVATSLKHFPGLGRATGNTDSDPTATDPTVRGDAFLRPFRAGIRAGAPFVMVSSATYPGISPVERACFSTTVMRDMLRGDLGFDGIVLSDSFGSASVSSVPPGRRAVRFLAAGGTMVLDSNYLDAGPMAAAVLDRMERDAAFAGLVEGEVKRVLAAKERYDLLG